MIRKLMLIFCVFNLLTACTTKKSTPTPTPLPPTATPIPPTTTPLTLADTTPARTATKRLTSTEWLPRPTSTITPTPTYPAERLFSPMVYSPKADLAIQFGGIRFDHLRAAYGEDDTPHEVWLFDPQAMKWKMGQLSPADCVWLDPGTYDSQADRVLQFCTGSTGKRNIVYEYDPAADAWKYRDAANRPAIGYLARMAYDAESDKTIFVEGIDPWNDTQVNETWAYDYDSNAWTKMNPTTQPPGRWQFTLAYDSESDRVILWGGRMWAGSWFWEDWTSEAYENLVWAYDYNTDTWESFPVINGPELPHQDIINWTHFAASVYDPDLDRTFFYWDDQFWAYDYNSNTWEKAKGDLLAGPGTRKSHSMAYLASIQRILVFGGASKGTDWNSLVFNGDTWLYDPQTGDWTKAGP